jgi:glycosyltransferase involved in cell wall biosynthesis
MNNEVLVSIITPNFNCEKYIASTIESVICQTYPYWEMIIVDDFSTDRSIEIIERYILKDNRIKLIKLYNTSGPAIARNTAIKEAKGRYIAFLDSDDLWYPDKLEKQIKYMHDKKCALSYSYYDVMMMIIIE